MTNEPQQHSQIWRAESVQEGEAGGQALLIGPGPTYVVAFLRHAQELAEILNSQVLAIQELQDAVRAYDCRKGPLAHDAMVPCANLPNREECMSCRLTRSMRERNSYCVCIDDDDFPSGPAEYCPVHGNPYRYATQEEIRLLRTLEERDQALARAEAAEARVAELEGRSR